MTIMARNDFTFASFGLRFAFALALVLLTYNPTSFSWVSWLLSGGTLVYVVAAGVVLLIGWVMFLRATWNSLGGLGTALAGAFFGLQFVKLESGHEEGFYRSATELPWSLH